jgi:hypothetical protein
MATNLDVSVQSTRFGTFLAPFPQPQPCPILCRIGCKLAYDESREASIQLYTSPQSLPPLRHLSFFTTQLSILHSNHSSRYFITSRLNSHIQYRRAFHTLTTANSSAKTSTRTTTMTDTEIKKGDEGT